jgi:hypothetical protein
MRSNRVGATTIEKKDLRPVAGPFCFRGRIAGDGQCRGGGTMIIEEMTMPGGQESGLAMKQMCQIKTHFTNSGH